MKLSKRKHVYTIKILQPNSTAAMTRYSPKRKKHACMVNILQPNLTAATTRDLSKETAHVHGPNSSTQFNSSYDTIFSKEKTQVHGPNSQI